jgi:hypothetical protein
LRDGRRFLGVEVPLLLQFSIALFTGMVAATLVPPVRKSIPRPVEVGLWIALVVVCVTGVVSITNPVVRELTSAAFWGVDRIITTTAGLLIAGVVGWIFEHRFPIANWVVLLCGADIIALAMLRSHRKGTLWQPHVRLREWMELPRLSAPAQAPVVVPYALDELNRKWAAASALAGAAILTGLISLSIWARDELLPRQTARLAHAAALGRVGSRARLESFRDTAAQLQFAARAWYAAAGAPAVNGLAVRATEAVQAVRAGRSTAGVRAAGRMVDIHVLMSAQSIGWYGPLRPEPAVPDEEEEDASGQTGRLAS